MLSQNDHYLLCTYPQTLEFEPLPLTSSFHYVRRPNTPLREPRITETSHMQADIEAHFCFNPGQPHHLISMYKRTSEYKRASKYKWHERLKAFICHPRKVTWQLSCRDWSLMPSWPSSPAKVSLRRIWSLGCRAGIWKFVRRRRWKKWARSPENLRAEILTKEKNTISGMNIFSAQIADGVLLRRGKNPAHIWS